MNHAKRFFYAAAGILLLVIAYSIGARDTRADWDSSFSGRIVGAYRGIVWTAGGEAWQCGNPGYYRFTMFDLPVPASEVKLFTGGPDVYNPMLITKSDDAWYLSNTTWVHVGTFLGGTVQVERKSWSSVKDDYRK